MDSPSVTVAADLSAKIIILCSKYFVNVAHARGEVERLKEQLKSLETTLRQANHLLEHPNSQLLSASRELNDPLQKCQAELQRLRDKLEPNTKEKAMRRFGLRAAKWPLSKGEVEAIVASLVEYREAIIAILQIDQTRLLLNINQRIDDLSLQSAENRSMDLKPHFIIPFPRDPDFVDRPALRGWLEEQYNASPARRLALVGMGGFGKSQIAIEFAYRVHIASPETNVFWVYGGTAEKFEESYRSLANALALPDRHDPDINVLALVRDWLQRTEAPPWLIILDNADEMETFFPSKSQSEENRREPLASYLPKTGNGKIIITSRNRSVAEKLTGSHKAIQEVPTMDGSEALKILENKLSQDIDNDAAIDLARALNSIPLAVNQAAAYINRRAPRVSIRSYLDEFRQSEKKKKSLLNRDAGDLRRREDVSNSVVVTWQVTFEQIQHERPTAANLLLLMSFFQPQNIPEFMLSGYNCVTSDVEDLNFDNDEELDEDPDEDLEDDLDVLRGYSLIRLSTTSGLCDMHALVQFCTKVWLLESNGSNFSRLQSLFLSLSVEHFPGGEFETWPRCQLLLPHVNSLLDEEPTDEPSVSNWCELLSNISRYMRGIGNYSVAESIAKKALDSSKKLLGDEDQITVDIMQFLSTTYVSRNRYDEAELLLVQVIETVKRIWGDEHPKTLKKMSLLTTVYELQEKYTDAESLLVQMVEISNRLWGDEHPKTLENTSRLTSTYLRQGKLAEAEFLSVKVTEISKKIQRGEHAETPRALSFLAETYTELGRLAEAELLVTQEMEIRKAALGDEHPDTLDAMNHLATILRKQGRLIEAESLYAQVVETRKKMLGDEHPDTLVATVYLLNTYQLQGRLTEAESLCVQVIQARKRVLGNEHPDTLVAMVDLAYIFRDQGRFNDALELLRDAVSRLQHIAGPGHEETVYEIKLLREWEQEQTQDITTQENLKT